MFPVFRAKTLETRVCFHNMTPNKVGNAHVFFLCFLGKTTSGFFECVSRCFLFKSGNAYVFPNRNPQNVGNACVFPLLNRPFRGNAYVLSLCFLVFPRTTKSMCFFGPTGRHS